MISLAKGIAGLQAGMVLGASPWHRVTQEQIKLFAQVTLDEDPMHVDPAWAKKNSPFGDTIAFGFLTLSLLTHFAHEVSGFAPLRYALNYGFDRLRFLTPVPVDSRIRAHFEVAEVVLRPDGGQRITLDVRVEIEGQAKPAMVASWLFVAYAEQAPRA